MKPNQRLIALLAVLALMVFLRMLLVPREPDNGPPPTPEQMIAQIENNPHIPPKGKAMALAAIRSHMKGTGASHQ